MFLKIRDQFLQVVQPPSNKVFLIFLLEETPTKKQKMTIAFSYRRSLSKAPFWELFFRGEFYVCDGQRLSTEKGSGEDWFLHVLGGTFSCCARSHPGRMKCDKQKSLELTVAQTSSPPPEEKTWLLHMVFVGKQILHFCLSWFSGKSPLN